MTDTTHNRVVGREEGFTLIELLVVIVILGILLVIAVPAYAGFRDRSARGAAKADVRAAIPAVEAWYQDKGSYTAFTTTLLKGTYDTGLSPKITKITKSKSAYCIAATVNNHVYKYAGPGGTVTSGNC